MPDMERRTMCLRVALKAALMIALTPVFQVTGVYSQSKPSHQDGGLKSYKLVSPETYDRVLDILFPRDDSAKYVFVIVLRFKPSFQPESQVVIRRGLDRAEITEYTSLSGNVYSKLNDVIAHGGKEDVVEMAKLIKVRKRLIDIPYAQVKQWHTSFLDSIRESLNSFKEKIEEYDTGTSTIALDGTFYDLWYKQISDEISFRLYDREVNDLRSTGDLKIVQWMNTVRRDVSKLK
jgi:hypothetical protein